MSADLARLLRIIADGREEYARNAPDRDQATLLTEAAAFRSAALLAEGEDNTWRLLPTWRITPEVEELAQRVAETEQSR